MNSSKGESNLTRSADRIQSTIEGRQPALMPYFPIGYPDLGTSREIIRCLCENGADLIELGIPFSDPLADGPVIQNATQVALRNGITVEDCLSTVASMRTKGATVPAVFMTYYNPVYRYGVENFIRACADVQVDGLIIPDLPVEESDELQAACKERGIATIFMLTPNTPETRIDLICGATTGFVYLVAVLGITGPREQIPDYLRDFTHRVRNHTNLPLAVGFGISTARQAREVAGFADGIIIGSALVARVQLAIDGNRKPVEAAKEFVSEVVASIKPTPNSH
jgi:tryptophan synthase alpha chain